MKKKGRTSTDLPWFQPQYVSQHTNRYNYSNELKVICTIHSHQHATRRYVIPAQRLALSVAALVYQHGASDMRRSLCVTVG